MTDTTTGEGRPRPQSAAEAAEGRPQRPVPPTEGANTAPPSSPPGSPAPPAGGPVAPSPPVPPPPNGGARQAPSVPPPVPPVPPQGGTTLAAAPGGGVRIVAGGIDVNAPNGLPSGAYYTHTLHVPATAEHGVNPAAPPWPPTSEPQVMAGASVSGGTTSPLMTGIMIAAMLAAVWVLALIIAHLAGVPLATALPYTGIAVLAAAVIVGIIAGIFRAIGASAQSLLTFVTGLLVAGVLLVLLVLVVTFGYEHLRVAIPPPTPLAAAPVTPVPQGAGPLGTVPRIVQPAQPPGNP